MAKTRSAPATPVVRSEKARRARRRRRIKITLALLTSVVCLGFVALGLFWQQKLNEAEQNLPDLPAILAEVRKRPTEILSADEVVLMTIATEYRRPVTIDQIPQKVIDATLAAEDHRFYQHTGIDFLALVRALAVNLREGETAQGGSTLTMQISKRVITGGEQTLDRKIRDMAMASVIERQWTKDQILEFYLNQVFYGARAYGIAAAADVYFGKTLDQLTLAEAALLARLVRRPSQDNPFRNPARAIENRDVVLGIMLEQGMITQAEYDSARREPLRLADPNRNVVTGEKLAPYFVDHVFELLEEQFPDIDITAGGYRIYTTLNYDLQKKAEEEVRSTVAANASRRVTTGAFLLLDNRGRVLAMVGGVDYKRNQFNACVLPGRRQPGSSFKPFVYAAAIATGAIRATGTVRNDPFMIQVSGRRRAIEGGGGGGTIGVQRALASSNNTAAMWVAKAVGPENAARYCRTAFGFVTEIDPVPSIPLGSTAVSMMEMAVGYSVFQNGGDRVIPMSIVRVVGPSGNTLRRYEPRRQPNVMEDGVAENMDRLLRGCVVGGTGSRAAGVVNARGKTGTTSDHMDLWFAGYTDRFIGIAWVANEQANPGGRSPWIYRPMARIFGGEIAAPMWARILKYATEKEGEPNRNIPALGGPAGTGPTDPEEEVDPNAETPESGGAASPDNDQPDRGGAKILEPDEFQMPETVPPLDPVSPGTGASLGDQVWVTICADSGQRAGAYCPERTPRAFARGEQPTSTCTLHGRGH